MNRFASLLLLAVFTASSFPSATQAQENEATEKKAKILVDDDKVQCPNAAFTSIQAAVSAAHSGDTIRVCPGTYDEQVVISMPLSIEGDNGAVVIPSNVKANGTDIPGGIPIAAVLLVTNTRDVEIEGLIIDGSNNGITECGPRLEGITFQNSTGLIEHNAVRHIRLSPSLPGCQSGDAIIVETASGLSSNVQIRNNSVWDYQKNGITANETGTQSRIEGNVVTGIGPTTGAAQNGIQIGFGAGGSIIGNTSTSNIWSPCVSPKDCVTNATGILIFESDDVLVEDNSLGSNQIGVFVGGNNSTVISNNIFDSVVLIGVALVGDDNHARLNGITHSDQAAVFIQGNGNRVRNNKITDAAIGVLKISGSSGSVITDNQFFATPITAQDPVPHASIQVVPQR